LHPIRKGISGRRDNKQKNNAKGSTQNILTWEKKFIFDEVASQEEQKKFLQDENSPLFISCDPFLM